jgi:hypothetical protein
MTQKEAEEAVAKEAEEAEVDAAEHLPESLRNTEHGGMMRRLCAPEMSLKRRLELGLSMVENVVKLGGYAHTHADAQQRCECGGAVAGQREALCGGRTGTDGVETASLARRLGWLGVSSPPSHPAPHRL